MGKTGSPVAHSHFGEDGEGFSREETAMLKLIECPRVFQVVRTLVIVANQETGCPKMQGAETRLMLGTGSQEA